MPKRDTIVAFPEIAAVPTGARGKSVKGLEHVQKFLNRFGYLAEMEICEAGVLDVDDLHRAQALPAQAGAQGNRCVQSRHPRAR